jgi:hypothetical protein
MTGDRWLLVVGFSVLGLTGLGTAYQVYLVSQILVRITEMIQATH